MALPTASEGRRDINAHTFAKRRLEELLVAHGWNTTTVAAALGVHRATVYRQMKRLGLEGAVPPGGTPSLPEHRETKTTIQSS
jgi:transcriptional regulator of acetoin/glycerol metabolism